MEGQGKHMQTSNSTVPACLSYPSIVRHRPTYPAKPNLLLTYSWPILPASSSLPPLLSLDELR